MKLVIDTDSKVLQIEDSDNIKRIDLYSKEAFEVISEQWVKVGWNEKYGYTFSWFGRPIIQLPEDMIRMQEVIYNIKPDVILETGVAHGGSLVYYASICKAMEKGRVIGVDIEIRPHNRKYIEEHELYPFITLIEGSSIEKSVIELLEKEIRKGEKVLVILDSCHKKEHVLKELEIYSKFIGMDSYIVATDGIMGKLHDVPRGNKEWIFDNPSQAATEFVSKNKNFVIEEPRWIFNESALTENVTHWPGAWIKRR